LLAEIGIESAPSPRTATANAILRIARDQVAAVATFLHAEVEVIEIGIQPGSHAAGKTIAQLHLPRDALVVAVVTTSGARIGHDATTLHPSDRAILLAKPTALPAARRVLE
jgi:trk system potassium uptake protein TrkA